MRTWSSRREPHEKYNPSDRDLCGHVSEGDRKALAVLYERYAPSVLRQFRGSGCPEAWVEDGTHEVFLKVWAALEQGHQPQRFGLWVRQIAHHVLIDYWRGTGHTREVLVAPPERSAPEPDLDAAILAEHLLAQLEPSLREIVVLHFYEDLTLAEVSRILGLPLGTTKSRLARAYRVMALQAQKGTAIARDERVPAHPLRPPVRWAVDRGGDSHA